MNGCVISSCTLSISVFVLILWVLSWKCALADMSFLVNINVLSTENFVSFTVSTTNRCSPKNKVYIILCKVYYFFLNTIWQCFLKQLKRCCWSVGLNNKKKIVHQKIRIWWKFTHSSCHTRCRWVCFFVVRDLEKICITLLAHQRQWMGAVRMSVQTAD